MSTGCEPYNLDTINRSRIDTFVTMDIIFISDLRAETIIGIYEWERNQKQVVAVDIEMATDIARSASSDSIEDALNYKAVSKRVEQFIVESSFQLVETLAERLSEVILNEFAVPWLRLTLHKPGALSNSKDVGIRIERGIRD